MNGTKSFLIDFHKDLRIDRRGVLRVGLGLLLLSPYLIWLLEVRHWEAADVHTWLPSLIYASTQALVSAGLSCALGFVMWHGLQAVAERGRAWAEGAALVPNMVPPLFLALSLLSVAAPFGPFPYGMGAVIAAHVLLNSGLVAVALDRLLVNQVGGMAETAWILGARPVRFWREIAWPQVRGDVACLFLFIYSLCFTSFSLPLLLSGARAVTLEVAIYDAIRNDGAWDVAVQLAALQGGLLLLFALILPAPFWPARPARARLKFLGWSWVRVLVFAPALFLLAGWALGLSAGCRAGLDAEVIGVLPEACLTSAVIGLATGGLHLLLFLSTAYVLPHPGLNRFLNGYLAPSAAITGFGLLLVPWDGDVLDLGKVVLALTLLSFPLLYRWLVHSALSALTAQVTVARTLGADWGQILFEIVWPQAGAAILKACGLAAVWAAGDFAVSGILLGGRGLSLPLLIQDQLGSYRFEQGALLLLPLVLLCVVLYTLFVRSARYVIG